MCWGFPRRRPKFLSTPSARRATRSRGHTGQRADISIHALREEGDPSSWSPCGGRWHFYPRPPRGGRRRSGRCSRGCCYFYPRPPRGGRRAAAASRARPADFYPRPPRGGRLLLLMVLTSFMVFLSTPSARRATPACSARSSAGYHFYPRPPRGGRRGAGRHRRATGRISIHALREEGDRHHQPRRLCTPISIHALREEGDPQADPLAFVGRISIHALREEGDLRSSIRATSRPLFLSTPSARRATICKPVTTPPEQIISIHALREEGDVQVFQPKSSKKVFLSTPSARRATNCASVYSAKEFEFLSTPSARRATLRPLLRGRRRMDFYPRPPRGGRHHFFFGPVQHLAISIHALREEGDPCRRKD